jgi:uncharacterized protein DUF4160
MQNRYDSDRVTKHGRREEKNHLPTILLIRGWRFFFYANEANEPIHIHCRKAEKECKYWLDRKNFDVEEAFSYRMTGKEKREVKRIIEHFEYIESEWDKFQEKK